MIPSYLHVLSRRFWWSLKVELGVRRPLQGRNRRKISSSEFFHLLGCKIMHAKKILKTSWTLHRYLPYVLLMLDTWQMMLICAIDWWGHTLGMTRPSLFTQCGNERERNPSYLAPCPDRGQGLPSLPLFLMFPRSARDLPPPFYQENFLNSYLYLALRPLRQNLCFLEFWLFCTWVQLRATRAPLCSPAAAAAPTPQPRTTAACAPAKASQQVSQVAAPGSTSVGNRENFGADPDPVPDPWIGSSDLWFRIRIFSSVTLRMSKNYFFFNLPAGILPYLYSEKFNFLLKCCVKIFVLQALF